MKRKLNVLSLFDGISCGQIALKRNGIEIENYFASEIEKEAIFVTQKNHPNTIQIGDVTKVNSKDLPKIDLMIGGSPCQTVSAIGNQSGFDGSSGLFYEYFRLLSELRSENPNLKFLLENVPMKNEWKNEISKIMGVQPLLINSSLVSAQSRKRLYWTNIEFEPLIDKGIKLQDILEYGTAHREKSKTVRVGGRMSKDRHEWDIADTSGRTYTRLELERLQTLPEGYTDCISETKAFKAIGNGWNVDTIAHIFSGLD